jgi:tetratricopeptide (TPR) repeat protein
MNAAEIRAGLHESHTIPNGRLKAERLETLAAAAKAAEDRGLEGEVLLTLIEAYAYGGERDRMPVAFGRLLRIFDDHPAELGRLSQSIHWELKWMTHNLVNNPSVPLATTYRWLDELHSRYRQRGYSARPVLALRAELAHFVGDDEAAAAAMESSIAAPRDEMADCDACERNTWGWWRETAGDDEGALEFWTPLIGGELVCAEEPHRALSQALLPLVRTGRLEEARSAFLKGYQLVRHNVSLRASVGNHIEFCALTGNEARGLEILTEHASWVAEQPHDLSQRADFLSGVIVLLRRLNALGHGDLPVGAGTVETTLAALELEVGDLCARYDARHGTTAYSERVARRLAREPLLDRLPLGVPVTLPAAPRPSDVPAPARRTGATLDELVAEARRLTTARHPLAEEAWARVAEGGEPLPEFVAAEVERSRATTLMDSDPGRAHDLLSATAERFAELGAPAKALEARAAATVALLLAKGRAAAEAPLAALLAEADREYAGGTLTPAEYLAVRKGAPFCAMNSLARQEDPPAAEVTAARALLETELALAGELGVVDRAGQYHDMLVQLCFQLEDVNAARAHLSSALTSYVDAGQPWYAVNPAAMLAQFALEDGDAKAAEDLASRALEYGGGLIERERAAHLSSLLVETISRQEGRELDLVTAALTAATRWDGLSEPDTLHNTFMAARAYHFLDRHAEAAALFEEAMPRVEIPYDPHGIAMTRKQYGDSLAEIGRPREAAEQYLEAARLLQDDPDNRVPHARLAWAAAEALRDAGQSDEALAAYQKAALLWGELGEVTPRVRCLRSAAWLLLNAMDDADPEDAGATSDAAEWPAVVAMRAVLTELESLKEGGPSEEVMAELAETRRQLDSMLGEPGEGEHVDE